MKLLKKLARYILRTEFQTQLTRIKALEDLNKSLNDEVNKEKIINEDLKRHFSMKTTPIEFYKELEKNEILMEDLMSLKNALVFFRKFKSSCDKDYERFKADYEMEISSDVNFERMLYLNDIKYENEKKIQLYSSIINSLEKINAKLSGIID